MPSKESTVFLKKRIYVQANRREQVNGKGNGVPEGKLGGRAAVEHWEGWGLAVPGTVAAGSWVHMSGEAPGAHRGHTGKGSGNTMKSWT